MTYLNNTYSNKNDYVLDYFKNYYLDYFERQIPINTISTNGVWNDYFKSADELISLTRTETA